MSFLVYIPYVSCYIVIKIKKEKEYLMNVVLKKISKMDREELDMLVDVINARRSALVQEAVTGFKVGDVVEFDTGRRAGIIQGTIIKKKIKNIVVKPFGKFQQPGNWNVTASLLTKVAA